MIESENDATSTNHLSNTTVQSLSIKRNAHGSAGFETGSSLAFTPSRETTHIALTRHGRELEYQSDRLTRVEKILQDLVEKDQNSLMAALSELRYELDAAKKQNGEHRQIHLEGAKANSYQAWKILNRKQRYRSHALNFMLTLLSHNPLEKFSDESLQMLADLAREIERDHVDQDTMKAYTRLAIKLGLTLGAN